MYLVSFLEYTCWLFFGIGSKGGSFVILLSIICVTKIMLEWITPPPFLDLPYNYALPAHLYLNFLNPPLFNILESPYPSFVTGEERGFKLCLERLSVTQSKKHLFSQLEFIIFLQRCTSVSLDFSDTLMNIFTSFMPNKWVTIDGKYPPWMTEKIKQKMEQKKSFYKHLSNNGKRESDFVKLQSMVNELSEIISKRQYDYLDEITKKLQFFIYHSANSSIIVK